MDQYIYIFCGGECIKEKSHEIFIQLGKIDIPLKTKIMLFFDTQITTPYFNINLLTASVNDKYYL